MSALLERPRQDQLARQANRVMAAWLTQAFGAFGLLDLSFPNAALAAAIPGSLAGIADAGALPGAEADFLERFRTAGGHVPLFSAATAHDVPADAAWHQPEVPRIVYAEALPEPVLLRALLAGGRAPWFLLLAERGAEAGVAALVAEQGAEYAAAELGIGLGAATESYRFLLPMEARDGALSALSGAGHHLGWDVALDEREIPALRIETAPAEQGSPQLLTTLPAARLMHDGGYRSEADGSYTWLWSGPERHLRMALGNLPPFSRWLKVAIIGVPKAELLDKMAVSLNGARVPLRLERWSTTSAGVIVDLPAVPEADLILGLSVPRTVQEEQGERRLGFCVHKIEVFS